MSKKILRSVAQRDIEEEKNKKNLVSRRYINIQLLKTYAQRSLSVAPRLRFLILTEKDGLSIEEFLIKIDIWFRLLTEETTKTKI